MVKIGLNVISDPKNRELDYLNLNSAFKEAMESGELTGCLDRIIRDKENAELKMSQASPVNIVMTVDPLVQDWKSRFVVAQANICDPFNTHYIDYTEEEFKKWTAVQYGNVARVTPCLILTERNLIYRLKRCVHCGWYYINQKESSNSRSFCPDKTKRNCRQTCADKGCHPRNSA